MTAVLDPALIRERADIVKVVGDRIQLRKRGPDLKGLCPFHEPVAQWCPTCGRETPDGRDCAICEQWWADNPPPPLAEDEPAGRDEP